tara:strand:+ start:940 stop:1629 length:690 start_codon:yes stop_codon:yes gene_type:complete
MNKKIRYNVEKLYYDDYRVCEDGKEEGLNIYQNNFGKLEGGRQHDPIYNDENARRQIYTLGCSWTYGWDLKQTQTFAHLLGDDNTAIHNYGGGGTGFDFAAKKLTEVYIPESRRQLFIITIPHTFRRVWFDDDGVVYKSWGVPKEFNYNDYNIYFGLLHHYEMINKFVGRDKIIWGTWGEHFDAHSDVPDDFVDVKFDCVDYTHTNHPGPKSHELYAEKLKKIIEEKCK